MTLPLEAWEEEGDLRLLRDTARVVAKRAIQPRTNETDQSHEFPHDVARALAEAGFLSLGVPRDYGGVGASLRALAIVAEELGAFDASCAVIVTLQSTCTEVIATLATPSQKETLFARILASELMALALTEPDAGSDAASIRMTAEFRGDHYVLNGMKRYITNAEVATMLVTFAVTEPGGRGSGISTFVVDNPSDGLVFLRNEEKMGLHGTTTNEISFTDVRVPVENHLGEFTGAFAAGMHALQKGRVAIGALAVGLAQGALDQAVGYAQSRKQFGVVIGSFQGLQFMLADMAIATAAARELVYRAAELSDAGDRTFATIAAMAKCFATDVAMRVTTDAVQIFGGSGYMRGAPVERMMRDAKILQIFEGTNQIMRWLIARRLLDTANPVAVAAR